MRRAAIDQAIQRIEVAGFPFPLGVFPLEPLAPSPGYTEQFEQADGGESPGSYLGSAGFDDWEEWPDRFVYDILLPASRIRPLCRALVAMLPGRVYPILDVLGADAFREIDPHLAYELVGIERFYDGIREWDDWLFEDGLVGFGAMSVEPFFYFFLDEHKIVTVRAELAFKDRIEKLLAAFDLTVVEELKGPDSVEHEHRSVLLPATDDSEHLSADEIIERLRDAWGLQLNIDTTTNVDDDNNDLGVTAWQCVVRCSADPPTPPTTTPPATTTPPSTILTAAPPASQEKSEPEAAPSRSSGASPDDEPDQILAYAEVLLSADNLESAERLATEAVESMTGAPPTGWAAIDVIKSDRILRDQLDQWLADPRSPSAGSSPGSDPKRKSASRTKRKPGPDAITVHDVRWLVDPSGAEQSDRSPRLPARDQDH